MEAHAELNAALAALVGAGVGRLLVVDTIGDAIDAPEVERLAARDLARALADGDRPALVAVDTPTPTLLRALREASPALVAFTSDLDEDLREGLERRGIAVLGPHARIRIGAGDLVLTAPSTRLLDELARGLDPARIGLALAPTPAWIPTWLAAPALTGRAVVGFVDAAVLHRGWTRWLRGLSISEAVRHVLVPLGVEAPRVTEPRHPGLDAALAAHVLERVTGPLFPAAAVLAALVHDPQSVAATPAGAAERSLWTQARRALPLTGAAPGMEAPLPGLPLVDPPAAFLAQRALLRREQSLALARESLARPAPPEDHLTERSLEVLRSAGEVLSEHESKVVLRGFDVEVTRQAVASSASGAASFAEQIGFPVVLKAVSPDLRRKQEIGAVQLDLVNAAAVRRAYASILANLEQNAPTAHIDGVLVAEQVPPGLEIHCGAVRLADGHIALFGRPIGLSVPQEHVLAPCPLDPDEALLLAHAILTRVPVPALRRRSDPDVRTLAGLFLRLDAMVRATEDRLLLVDLNPIRLVDAPRGYVTLDARIVQRPHLEGL